MAGIPWYLMKKIWTQKNLRMDLLAILFWADETWLSAKPPFKVVTNHQTPQPTLTSYVARCKLASGRIPAPWPQRISLMATSCRKWKVVVVGGGGRVVFRSRLFWSVSRSTLKETQKNMLYTLPKLQMCFSKNPFSWNYGFSFLQQQGLNLPLKSFSWVGIFHSLPRRHQSILFLNLTSCKKIPNWQTHPFKRTSAAFGPVLVVEPPIRKIVHSEHFHNFQGKIHIKCWKHIGYAATSSHMAPKGTIWNKKMDLKLQPFLTLFLQLLALSSALFHHHQAKK